MFRMLESKQAKNHGAGFELGIKRPQTKLDTVTLHAPLPQLPHPLPPTHPKQDSPLCLAVLLVSSSGNNTIFPLLLRVNEKHPWHLTSAQ